MQIDSPAPQLSDGFADPEREQQFQAMRQALATPAPQGYSGLLLITTLALFVLAQLGNSAGWMGIVVLVAVLLFHELGHLAGMKIFGYRNVKMFFIPFFGAAVSGKRLGVASWKEGIVLLLGPLPGLVLGLALAAGLATTHASALHAAVWALVLINAFNLLPVSPLDGGRLFNLVLFSRHRLLEIGFAGFAGLALVASVLAGMYFLAIIGVLILVSLPQQWRLRLAADTLRRQHAQWSGEPAQLPEPQLRAAFVAARGLQRPNVVVTARAAANTVESLIDRAALRPPSVVASLVLVVAWAAGILSALAAFVLLDVASPPQWAEREVSDGGFSILMPRPAPVQDVERDTPFGPQVMRSLDVPTPAGYYTARWYDFAAGKRPADERALAQYLDRSRDKILERSKAQLAAESALPEGATGREWRIRAADGSLSIAQLRIDGERVFLLFAPAEPAEDSARFLASFKRLPAGAPGKP